MKSKGSKARRLKVNYPLPMKWVGLGSLLIVLLAVLALLTSSVGQVSAKDKDKDKQADKSAAKTLKIVSVDYPAVFQGTNPYPTKAGPNQHLVAITVDFDRDFKHHLRSSEAGEVYLTDGQATFYTVDTMVASGEGPGKKPGRLATFVFALTQPSGSLVLHYGAGYTLPLSGK